MPPASAAASAPSTGASSARVTATSQQRAAVPGDKRERRECDARRRAEGAAEAQAEHDVEVDAERQRKLQQGACGEQRGRIQDARRRATLVDDPVLQRWRNQKRNGKRHQQERARMQCTQEGREVVEALLKRAVEMKAEED